MADPALVFKRTRSVAPRPSIRLAHLGVGVAQRWSGGFVILRLACAMFQHEDAGEHAFKGIADPVRLFAVRAQG